MQTAYLILAHKNPEQLNRLINRVAGKDCIIFLHIDKKADIKIYNKTIARNDVIFIYPRVNITWAGYGTIQATLNGLKQILSAEKKFDYIHVISGQDYPIKPPEVISNFLQQHAGKEFIAYKSLEREWQSSLPKIRKYHFTDWKIPGKFRLQFLFNFIMPERKFPFGWEAFGEANWFTITPKCAAYILEFVAAHKEYVRFFKLTSCGDEIFFTTIILHSPFKENVVNNNLRYVDWSEQKLNPQKANPKILLLEDFEALQKSKSLFARKFDDEKDSSILDKIDRELLHISRQVNA